MGRVVHTFPTLALAAVLAAPVTAQNLLTNPDFTSDVAGWDSNGGVVEHAAADGVPTPGSAELDDYGFGADMHQCVDVSGLPTGTPIAFGGYVQNVNFDLSTSFLALQLLWFPTADCTEANLVGGKIVYGGDGNPQGEWLRIACFAASGGCAPTKPEGANSLRLEFLEAIAGSGATIRVDSLFATAGLLFADEFDLGHLRSWSDAPCPAAGGDAIGGPHRGPGDYCYYVGAADATCDEVCASLGGANLAHEVDLLWDDGCTGAGAGDVAMWFYQNGNPGGWVGSTSETNFRTIGYGYPAGGFFGKCTTGTLERAAYPGETNTAPGTRNLVCACF